MKKHPAPTDKNIDENGRKFRYVLKCPREIGENKYFNTAYNAEEFEHIKTGRIRIEMPFEDLLKLGFKVVRTYPEE